MQTTNTVQNKTRQTQPESEEQCIREEALFQMFLWAEVSDVENVCQSGWNLCLKAKLHSAEKTHLSRVEPDVVYHTA